MNFSCCDFPRAIRLRLFNKHVTEPVQENFIDGSTDSSIGITIVLRRAARQNILIQPCKLCRAPQRAEPLRAIHARILHPSEFKKSTAFHPTAVVNGRIGKYPQPHGIISVDEIALVYKPWTLLAKFRY